MRTAQPRPRDQSVAAGLCADCRHARAIETRRGSRFVLCERAATDSHFARYPPLPVLRCPGHEPIAAEPGPSEP